MLPSDLYWRFGCPLVLLGRFCLTFHLPGHGVSIGSIATGWKVDNVMISNNTVTNSAIGLRIKTVYGATDASGKVSVFLPG
jgi:polygalacturonase